MRGAASRRVSRRSPPRLIEGGSAVAPDFCKNIDVGAFAAEIALALARGRVFADPAVAVGALLADALPALQAEFALAIDAEGRVVASAADFDDGPTAEEADALLAAGRAAIAGDGPTTDGDILALPLATDRVVVGALALKSPCPFDRPGFQAAADFLARCVADMAAMGVRRAQDRPAPGASERQGVADRLIEALASHGDGVALFGPDRGLVAANAAFTAAHGATVRELKGLTLEEILRRGHDGLSPLWIGRDLSDGDGAAGAEMALAADGRWLRLSRRRSPAGDEMVIQTAADDVVGRAADARRRDRLLARDAAARQRIWDGLPVGAILLSRASRILEVNAAAADLLRATAEDLKGRRLGRLADRLSDAWSLVGRSRGGGGPLAAKARRLPDGEVLLILTELPEDAPPPKAIERDQAERALAATRALGELGHEMRTPLNAVIGFADVMLARSFGPVNDRQAQYLQDIANAGRHMLDMVDHMLDHAQLTAGAYPIQPEWTGLRAIAAEAVRFLEPAASSGEVALRLGAIPDLDVYVDRRSLLQVLINLLGNAVKFTPAGGRVALSAEQAADGLHIVVADTGEGIDAADLARVREPFTQARRLGGRPLKGAGLGLAIVSAIAGLHDGEVDIASTPGEGTEVTFRLPLNRTRDRGAGAE